MGGGAFGARGDVSTFETPLAASPTISNRRTSHSKVQRIEAVLLFCILCSDVKVEERALQCGNPPRRNHPPASDGRLPLRNLVLHYPESSLLEIDVSARMEGHGGGWNVQPVLRLAQSETGKTGPFPPAEVEPGRRLSCYGTAALTPTPRPTSCLEKTGPQRSPISQIRELLHRWPQ